MKNFYDLNFVNGSRGGTKSRLFFENGYGVSVVRSDFSYGGPQGLFELAVLEGTEQNFKITYSTSVTGDVEGYLKESQVTELMNKIQSLPKKM